MVGNEKIIDVSFGDQHVGAIIDNNDVTELYMWGWNQFCQLGDGLIYTKNSPMLIDFDKYIENEEIIDIELGNDFSSLVTYDESISTNTLYKWEDNKLG